MANTIVKWSKRDVSRIQKIAQQDYQMLVNNPVVASHKKNIDGQAISLDQFYLGICNAIIKEMKGYDKSKEPSTLLAGIQLYNDIVLSPIFGISGKKAVIAKALKYSFGARIKADKHDEALAKAIYDLELLRQLKNECDACDKISDVNHYRVNKHIQDYANQIVTSLNSQLSDNTDRSNSTFTHKKTSLTEIIIFVAVPMSLAVTALGFAIPVAFLLGGPLVGTLALAAALTVIVGAIAYSVYTERYRFSSEKMYPTGYAYDAVIAMNNDFSLSPNSMLTTEVKVKPKNSEDLITVKKVNTELVSKDLSAIRDYLRAREQHFRMQQRTAQLPGKSMEAGRTVDGISEVDYVVLTPPSKS